MQKVRLSDLSVALLAISIFTFAFRGKVGAIFITLSLLCNIIIVIQNKKRVNKFNLYVAFFLFVFAFVLNFFRSLSPEYYLIIGYLAASVVLLEPSAKYADGIWKWFKGIAIFEAFGVYLQWLFPGIYYPTISVVFPNEVINSITSRFSSGYCTGFSREVSYTMFLIAVGLGVFIFFENQKKRISTYFIEFFLFGALLISGKRATLFFFLLANFVTNFIRSRNKHKIMKYAFCGVLIVVTMWFTYPIWSKIQALSRFTEMLQYFSLKDMNGATNGRITIYINAIQLWNTNPWFGIGWGNFKYSVLNGLWYSGFDVHNCFLQILCETGIVGMVFYALLCIISIKNCYRSILLTNYSLDIDASRKAAFFVYIQFFFILYSLTEPILYEYTDFMIFFICFACNSILLKEQYQKVKLITKVSQNK